MNKTDSAVFSKSTGPHDDVLAEQAIDWFARRQTGELSEADYIRFQSWQAQSSAHRQAYEQVSQLWDDADFNRALALSSLSYTANRTGKPRKRRLAACRIALAAAASIAALALLFDPLTRLQADYYTAAGEQETVRLSDGSSVTLNTDTAIAMAFSGNQRRLRLLKGEAYFDVQPDAGKPFVIDSGGTETTVLGTRFIVRDDGNEDKVSVIKGLVQVSNPAKQQQVLLHADQQVGSGKTGLTGVQTDAAHRDSSWLNGRVKFQDASLEQVAAELGRYLSGAIVISNDSLKQYRVDARFDITQPRQALETLQQTLPVKVNHLGPWLTVISPR